MGLLVAVVFSNKALALSSGCAAINFTTTGFSTSGTTVGTGFNAGEVITITITNASGNAVADIFDNTTAVELHAFSSTSFTYTFPANTSDQVQVQASGTSSSDVIHGTCAAASSPTSITSISPNTGIPGGGASVTISGAGFTGTSSVTFGGTAATGITVVNDSTLTVTTPAHATGSVSVVVTSPNGTATKTSGFTYAKSSSSTVLQTSGSPSASGAPVTFTATVTGSGGTPTGTVTFQDSDNPIGTGTLSGGVATFTISTLAVGSHAIDASYGGSSSFNTSLSQTMIQTINPPASTSISSISPNSGPVGGGTSVTISGTGFTGTSSVTFGGTAATGVTVVNSTTLTVTTPAHAAGAVNVVVTASSGTATSTNGFTYTQTSSTTTLQTSANPSISGQSVTFTATVTGSGGTPTGTVTFKDGSTTLGTGTLSGGVATLSTAALVVGSHSITANYGGDTTFTTSTSTTTTQVVNPATSISSISPNVGLPGGGTSVTISGVGFTGASSVTFGGTAATGVTVVNSTTLTVTTPAHAAGAVNVVVTSPSGTATSTGGYTYAQASTTTALQTSGSPSISGQSVTFTATVTGSGATPTGTVTFKDGGTTIGTGTLSGGVATLSTSALTVGSHSITASYGGDGNFTTSTSAATTQVINPATAISSISPNSGFPSGGTSVKIQGAGFTNTTSVTFGGVAASGLTVVNDTTLTVTTPAHAAGAVNVVVTSPSGTATSTNGFTYAQSSTSVSLTPSANPSISGQSVTFTATVSGSGGTPTGTVTFKDGGTTLGTGTLSGGTATFTTSSLAIGSHSITASYGGDTNFASGNSTTVNEVVNAATAISSITPNSGPPGGGTSVTIQGAGFTGTTSVTFGGVAASGIVVNSDASLTVTTPAHAAGVIDVTVTSPNGSATSTGGFSYVMSSTSVALQSSANPSISGQSVTFTATVTSSGGTPTGTVTFKDGGTTIGTGGLSGGVATFSTSSLIVGSHSIVASYGGDTNFSASDSATVTQVVNPATSVTSVSPNTGSPLGGTVVTIQGVGFTGTTAVTFDGVAATGVSVTNDTTLTATTPAHALGAVNAAVTSPSGSATLTNGFTYVAQSTSAALQSSANPSLTGQSVTFTATVTSASGTPTGTVTFEDGGASIGTGALSGGVATFTTTALATGSHTITANYGGATGFNTSTSSAVVQTVNPVTNISSVSPNSGPLAGGTAITIQGAGFTGTTSVTFGGVAATGITVVNDTTLTVTTPAHAAGAVDVVVTSPNGTATLTSGFAYSSTATSMSLQSSLNPSLSGQSVTFTATITGPPGTPTGTVTFKDGTTTLGTGTVSAGSATFSTSALSFGSHSITATYGGDGNFNPGTSAVLTQTVDNAIAVTSVTPNTGFPSGGTSVTIAGAGFTGATSVTFGGVAATNIVVVSDSSLTATTPAHAVGAVGVAVTSPSGSATLASGFTYATSSSSVALQSSLNPSVAGQSVTFTATVSGSGATPTGTVTFKDGTTTLGTGTVSGGVATFATTTLATGTHSIVASYGGDTNFSASDSAAVSQVVNPATTITSILPNAGFPTGGTSVTIQGAGFTGTTSVTFGGVAATGVTVTNDTTLVATTPAHAAGAVNVVVTSPNGTATSSNGFTYSTTATGVVLQSSLNPSLAGQSVTFTATVSGSGGTPTGTVTFKDGAATLGTGTLTSGVTTLSTTALSAGAHNIVASYGGDSNFNAANSASLTQTVNNPITITSIIPNSGFPTGGTSVTIQGTGFTGTTSVTFGGVAATNIAVASDSSLTVTTPAHAAGAVNVVVTSPSGSATSTSGFTYSTSATGVALQSSLNPSISGHSVTFTATVTSSNGTPTGTVTFKEGTTTLGTGGLSAGVATFSTSALTVGSHNISASYGGDANFNAGDSSVVTQVVNAATSITSIAPNSGFPTGGTSVLIQGTGFTGTTSVTFGGVAATNLAVASDTSLTVTTPAHAVGAVDVTVTSPGGSATSSNGYTFGILASSVALQSSANPSISGQSITLTATVTGSGGTPSGTVTFRDGAATLGTGTLSAGVATLSTSALTSGSHSISASYGGDSNFGASNSSALNQAVNTATSITSISPNNGPLSGGTVVTIQGTGFTGATSVTFGGTAGTNIIISSDTTLTVTTPAHAAGAVNVAVTSPNGGATTANGYTYNAAVSTVALQSSANPSGIGQPVTFTATVSGSGGTPTGTVTFKDGSSTIGTGTLSAGVATFSLSSLIAGAHSITASYGGDTNFGASNSPAVNQTVNSGASIASISPNSGPPGGGGVVIIEGSGFTGTVSVTFGGVAATSVTVVNSTTIRVTAPPQAAGVVDVTVTAAGGSATSPHAFTYVRSSSTVALRSSINPSNVGQSVSFTATASGSGGTPTGTITFKDGAVTIGSAALSGGIATLSTATLAAGNHSITANYAGSTNFNTSVSPALVQSVAVPADSLKLRSMQLLVTPMVAQNSGTAISGAVDSAISEAFGGGGSLVMPSSTGLRLNFSAEPDSSSDTTGSVQTGNRNSSSSPAPFGNFALRGTDTSATQNGLRSNNPLNAYGAIPTTRTSPERVVEPRDWYGWAEIRGAILDRWSPGSVTQPSQQAYLYGHQINVLLGLTRVITPNFVVGVLGGYETFDYRSDALLGQLKGDGWTVGAYVGWKLTQAIRYDASAAYSGIGYDGTAATASGNFKGNRWFMTTGLTGTYSSYGIQIEPSARIYALWEHESAYTDSLGTPQASRDFATGRASGGVKISYPLAWSQTVLLAPFVGFYGDYYFNGDNASVAASSTPTVFVLDGWSSRITGGLAATFKNESRITIAAERSGLGSNVALWTYRANASVAFAAQ